MEKYILWDFEKTLAYCDHGWTQTLVDLCKEHRVHITYEELKPLLSTGLPWYEFEKTHKELFKKKTWWQYAEGYLTTVLERCGIHKSAEIVQEFKNYYLDAANWHLYDDAISTLDTLKKQGYKMILAANFTPELSELAEKLGISQYFDQIISSADGEYEKPNAHFYKAILDSLEENDEVIMIGDNYNADIRGAMHAGIKRAILVHNANKTHYNDSVQELAEIIDELIK